MKKLRLSRMNRNILKIFFAIILFCAIVFPFLIEINDEYNNKLMLSFTALASTATFLTLVIALLLYRKLTIDPKIIDLQTDKVLELVDFLKGKQLSFENSEGSFLFRFDVNKTEELSDQLYKNILGQRIAFKTKELEDLFYPINHLCKSHWMPENIKIAARFFDVVMINKINHEELNSYCKLGIANQKPTNIGKSEDDEETNYWGSIMTLTSYEGSSPENPVDFDEVELIVNDFIVNKNIFVKSIDNWISEKTNIEIRLRLEENDKKIN
jgi:hypothetical protein